ncbi:MAG TPA: hypothetical protein PLG15_04380 [Candidatus Gastranaerophilaceae bacterium]|mgnify:CR=1 FL=1|nr:hypothetical protein [Candidatus Gastranaerophilaceae bacterium]HPT41604.1 hypothetical protein [Candidatus Gastranaerophilaceae bacterium]
MTIQTTESMPIQSSNYRGVPPIPQGRTNENYIHSIHTTNNTTTIINNYYTVPTKSNTSMHKKNNDVLTINISKSRAKDTIFFMVAPFHYITIKGVKCLKKLF